MNKDREQAINIIAKHVNNEIFTERELAEVVLDLALAHATNAEEFVRIIKELCKKDEYTLSMVYAKTFWIHKIEESEVQKNEIYE